MSVNPSKNDIAWQAIFQEEDIISSIQRDGYFYISSEKINKRREARLMTKFDHHVQLPKIFKDNHLSIQPVSRGGYVIGGFSSYFLLPDFKKLPDVKYCDLPAQIETINTQRLSSESSIILYAYLSGMIDDILDEETLFTVFGRMSTGKFEYRIYNSRSQGDQHITVENSQCEIDGGFEGESKFAIIEAKCQSLDDFIIRQLYYPYRLWKSKIAKEVIPIFLSFSNNIFTFYVFDFPDVYHYNSIQLKSIHRYCIGHYEIDMADLRELFGGLQIIEEDNQQTFPQADKFDRVIDLMDKLYINDPLTKDEITTEYAFDVRQADYYVSAGGYLGLFDRLKVGSNPTRYTLTRKGQEIMKLDPKRRNLELARAILSHKVFNTVFGEYLERKPSRERIIEIMITNLNDLNLTTIKRRSQTVEKWIDWIFQLTST
jgi:hypothetical protein